MIERIKRGERVDHLRTLQRHHRTKPRAGPPIGVVPHCVPQHCQPHGIGLGPRAAAPVRRHDAGEGRTGPGRAAAVLHVSAEQDRGPARLCLPQPVHSGGHYKLIRLPQLARPCAGLEPDRKETRCNHGCCSEPAADVAIGTPYITDKETAFSLSVTLCQAPPDRGRPTRRPGPMA